MITQGHIQQKSLRKNIWFRLTCYTFTRLCTKWFSSFWFSTKCSEWQDFLKIFRWKCLWKILWAWNQLNFTCEESTIYLINGKRWFKIMVNIPLIKIDSLLNYWWIYHILLKSNLFITQPNTHTHTHTHTHIWSVVCWAAENNKIYKSSKLWKWTFQHWFSY